MRLASLRRLAAPQRLDLLVAAVLLAWGLPDVPWWWEYPGHAGTTPAILGSLALTVTMSVPFYWRRTFPLPVLGAATGVFATRFVLHRDLISAFAAVLVAAYGLGAYSSATRRYARWLGWASLMAAAVWVTTQNYTRLAAVPFALLGAAFVLGDAASARRAEAAAAVEAAHQAERTRIARELHDVVAHQLSAIAVQAGAARMAAGSASQHSAGEHSASKHSAGEVGVLGTVEQLAREALAELSHLLGALRREPGGTAARLPAPSLRELDSLLATTRAAGVPATLATHGAVRPLSPGLELSAYRIIQEALTNVARHAPGAITSVALGYQADQLCVEVINGPPPAAPAVAARGPQLGGRGLRGMRERVELYRGTLQAGPASGGGFAVTAAIPYDGLIGGSVTGESSVTGENSANPAGNVTGEDSVTGESSAAGNVTGEDSVICEDSVTGESSASPAGNVPGADSVTSEDSVTGKDGASPAENVTREDTVTGKTARAGRGT